ncbi:MAG: extracellular solute-binding protein [Rhodospirillales bacterium]|nr:extracellular solute-binding protein [Rhodospirillales bacterium]
MKERFAIVGSALLLALPLAFGAARAKAQSIGFLSTQLRPVVETTRMRTAILKDFPQKVAFIPTFPEQLLIQATADSKRAKPTLSLFGALHGELEPLVPAGLLAPVDALAPMAKARGVPAGLMALARLGTMHEMYIPWMQATYIMAANRKALPYLPKGADLDHLSYQQLAQWAANITKATGRRMLGFPAGPKGLMPRFFEGYLYPSYTGGVVTTFKSPAAEKMWAFFKGMWKYVNPNSTNYNFMQEPLLSGDVWIAFDHESRLLDALRQKPTDFVAFPAPAGPEGRFYMPVIVGLGIASHAADAAGAAALVKYLLEPKTQLLTLEETGFFPVVRVAMPSNLETGVRLEAAAIQAMQSAPDAKQALLPVGLGKHDGEFGQIYMNTFQRIVLRGQTIGSALAIEAKDLQRIMDAAGAPCWSPDQPSQGVCQVR